MLEKTLYFYCVLLAQTILYTSATTIILYKSSTEFVEVPLSEAPSLVNHTYYNISKPNIIFTHGVNGSLFGTCLKPCISAGTNNNMDNIFGISWQKEAAVGLILEISYVKAVANCFIEFAKVGTAFYKMAQTGKFYLNDTTAFGFSLGAHCMCAAGRKVQEYGLILKRVSGCDPARALSSFYPSFASDCAAFVDGIYTDNVTGIYDGKAKANFWPNYGDIVYGSNVQNGCPSRDSKQLSARTVCSHNRCVQLWKESFSSNIEGSKAENYVAYIAGNIGGTSSLGYKTSLSAEGNYYLNTTACPPYQPSTRTTFYSASNVTITQNCQDNCPSS